MKTGDRRSSKAPSDATLLEDYQKMTGREMAERYGVSECTIRRWISNARRRTTEVDNA